MTEEKKKHPETKDEEEAKEQPVVVEVDIPEVQEEVTASVVEEETVRGKKPDVVKGRRLPKEKEAFDESMWTPKTNLGLLVKSGKIGSLHEVLSTGIPIREPEIVDKFLRDTLTDEVLYVNMVQRMTDSGRRTRFSITVVVGNSNGFVGLGMARGKEVGPTIKKAIDNAKLNIIELIRGCGSWECGCMNPHSIPFKVTGKSGSTEMTIRPAPRGVGLAVNDVAKKILKLAGINDIWGFSRGQTKTTVNNAMAVMDALHKLSLMKVPKGRSEQLKHVLGPLSVQGPPVTIGGNER
jgi:small subunit ribosomal protein S5